MRPRSIFWPLVLIATGMLWFLIDFGTVPSANLWALTYLLPYLLIALGVGLILRSRWAYAGMLVSSLVVAGALLAVVFAAPLGWDKAPSWGCVIGNTPSEGCFIDLSSTGSVPGSGVVKTESREVAEFTSVSVAYPADVVIRQGTDQSVTVEAEDNLLPQLATRVSGGMLFIENSEQLQTRRVKPTKPVRITLTVTDLHALDAYSAGSLKLNGLQTVSLQVSTSGAGSVSLSKLDVSSLSVDLSGAGSVEADGRAGTLNLDISGFGSFQGGDLAVQSASVDISGAGSATLWPKDELTANISGLGSVNYYGSPNVTRNVSGLGSVNKLGDK
jgi:hypothetical protein